MVRTGLSLLSPLVSQAIAVVEQLELKLHVFGHVHVGHGTMTRGQTTFVNACICDHEYNPVQPPIVVEL